MEAPHSPRYIGCHDCDALFTAPTLHEGERLVCPRCDAHLLSVRHNSVQRATAFALAAAVFFVAANAFPFLSLQSDYRESNMVLAQSVSGLESAGYPPLASAVAIFTLVAPTLVIGGLLYLLLPLLSGRRLPGAIVLCRVVHDARRWNMVEVYLLGVLVSMLKLGSLAKLSLGTSFWAFVGLIICLTASLACIDHHELWARLDMAAPERRK